MEINFQTFSNEERRYFFLAAERTENQGKRSFLYYNEILSGAKTGFKK
jgi:hypothetical protein